MDTEQQPTRQFKGIWIPKDIWENTTLSLTDRCLLADIHSYDEGNGCFASNQFLAKRFNVTKARMANLISKLRKDGWLKDRSTEPTKRLLKVCVPKGITENVIHEKRDHEKRDNLITKNVIPYISEKTVEIKEKTDASAPVGGNRKKAPQEVVERAQERERFKKMWIDLYQEVRGTAYVVLDVEFTALKTLVNTGKGPQGLIDMARDAWAHPEFGWNCSNLKSLTNFAKRFHEIEDELKQRKHAGKPSNQRRTDGNVGTANEGRANQYRDCGKVV